MGAHLNAYTSREQTVYYAKSFSSDLDKGQLHEYCIPSSQGWVPECPLGSSLCVYFVLVSYMVSGLRLLFCLPSIHFLS